MSDASPTIWQPIETLENNKIVLLYQPKGDRSQGQYWDEGIIVGSIDRHGWENHVPPFWVNVNMVGGYEWECEVTRPTYWMAIPEPPPK